MKKYIIYDNKQICSDIYSNYLARLVGGIRKEISSLSNIEMDSSTIAIFVLGVRNGEVLCIKKFLQCWEGIRHAKILFLLVGSMPQNSDMYGLIYERELPPAIRDKAYMVAVDTIGICPDEMNLVDNVLMKIKFLSGKLNLLLKNKLVKARECIELLK